MLAGAENSEVALTRFTPHALKRSAFDFLLAFNEGRRVVKPTGHFARAAFECLVVGRESPGGVADTFFLKRFGRAADHHFAARVTAVGPEVNHPVAGGNDVKVVFHDKNRVPGLNQAPQTGNQFGNVGKVKPRGRLIKDVERTAAGKARGFNKNGGKFEALRFASGERGDVLSEL